MDFPKLNPNYNHMLQKSSYSYNHYNYDVECQEANKRMSNKNNEIEKEEERGCGRLCPDCPMKNDNDLTKKSAL